MPHALQDFGLCAFIMSGHKEKKWLDFALRVKPSGSPVNTVAAHYHYNRTHDFVSAYMHAIRALHNYDGEIRFWEAWTNLGNILLINGSTALAKGAYQAALVFLPHYQVARAGLAQVEQVEKQMARARGPGRENQSK